MLPVNAVNYVINDFQPRHMQIVPDGSPGWAIRYLWITHRFNNAEFVDNYFTSGNAPGLNVRRQTQHLATVWENHNSVFDENAANGNLVWRVKCLNKIDHSIDYIEVWRDTEILEKIFNHSPTLKSGQQWTNQEKQELGQGIYDAGFEVRHLVPYYHISKKLAIDYYQQLVERSRFKDGCIINTQWNEQHNPL